MKAIVTRSLLFFAAFAVGIAVGPGAVQAQCIDYGDYLNRVGGVTTPSTDWIVGGRDWLTSIAISGDYAYLVQSWFGYDPLSQFSSSLQVIDIADPESSQIVATLSLDPGRSGRVAVLGDYVYVGTWHPGSAYPGGPPPEIRFRVIDVSNPVSPHQVASLSWQTFGSDTPPTVATAGDYAYVLDPWELYGGVLRVIDITDPTTPSCAGTVGLGDFNTYGLGAVAIQGHHAFVAGIHGFDFKIVDVSNPSFPQIVGSMGGAASSVAADGDLVYVGGYSGYPGFRVVDVSDPTSPQVVGSLSMGHYFADVSVSESVAFVTSLVPDPGSRTPATPFGGFLMIDVSDPASPQPIGGSPVPDARPGLCEVAVNEDLVYLGSRSGLDVFDVTSPTYAPVVGNANLAWGGNDVAVAGNYAYVPEFVLQGWGGSNASQLRVIDVADATDPQVVGTVSMPGALSVDLDWSGNYAHVGTGYGYSGVQELYVGDPASPQVVGGLSLPAPAVDVATRDSLLCAAADLLYTIDVSDPFLPEIVGSLDTPGSAMRVAIAGDHAYVVDGSAFLQVVDLSNPASPEVVGVLDIPGCPSARGVTVAGQHLYVTTGEWSPSTPGGECSQLHKIDISDPTSPTLLGSASTRETAWGIAVGGPYAYVAGGGSGDWRLPWTVSPGLLEVFDVGSRAAPQLLGSGRTTFGSIAVAGNLAFAPTPPDFHEFQIYGNLFEPGLTIYPAHCEQPVPVLLSGFTAEVRDRAVLLSWFTSFEDMHDGFNVYRSRALTAGYARLNDRLVRGRSPYSYLDSAVQPSTTYFYKLGAVDLDGHEVIHDPISVTTPAWGTRTELSLASPSPFRKDTVLRFTLAAPTSARLAVYDVAGRLVRVLMHEDLPVGDYDATWDGRDDAGLRVAGGAYFAKLTAGDVSQTRKVVYLGGK